MNQIIKTHKDDAQLQEGRRSGPRAVAGTVSRNAARYCINSVALRFIHREEMEAEGYAAYLNQVQDV
jgi:hypothetical protein